MASFSDQQEGISTACISALDDPTCPDLQEKMNSKALIQNSFVIWQIKFNLHDLPFPVQAINLCKKFMY
jgi:hypothetical protein